MSKYRGMIARWLFKDTTISSSLELFKEIYGSKASSSGVTVNVNRALQVATVLACCKVIAEGVSQIPWKVYQDKNGAKQPAPEHHLYNVIYRNPNRWQTSFEYRETLMFHTILTGNHYSFVNRVGSAREVRELIPFEPNRVAVERLKNDTLKYIVRADDGRTQEFPEETIWHVRGPSWNGWHGMDALMLAREAIGLAITTEQAHSSLHKNGAKVSGLLSLKENIGEDRYRFLAAWVDQHASGGARENKPLVLDGSADWKSMQMTGVDTQHIETREHQIEEICRAFRVMPIMVGHADKTATYASAEQMFLAHVVHTLAPWYQRLEQSADINLLSEEDRTAGYYTKFIPNALMRGAAKDRSEFYAKSLGAGGSPAWMTPNEVRALEEMNPIAGGDELPKPAKPEPPKPSDDEEEDDQAF